jgi:hypothetical protein
MTQLGESVSVAIDTPENPEKCVFCAKDHQDEKPAPKHKFPRDMSKLKREGRSESIALGRGSRYPGEDVPPLVEWESDITRTGGYKAAAHHCIALKSASDHEISGELKQAKYDPNDGSNCIWLPYSQMQFVRARAYSKPLQKHRGGHTDQYFTTVTEHISRVAKKVATKLCTENKKASEEQLLRFVKQEEKSIWLGVASATDVAFQLYNHSFLNPKAPWGTFPEEAGASQQDVLQQKPTLTAAAADAAESAESADDPE